MSGSASPDTARAVSQSERRLGQDSITGGRRATGTDYIADAIKAGDLKAEPFGRPGKRQQYRVHLDDFISFLQSIGFKRLPKSLPS
jgi:hypothetical protein